MGKRTERRERLRREKKRRQLIVIGLISLGVILIAAAILVPMLNPKPDISQAIYLPDEQDYPNAVGNALGDPDAPVKVVELSNYGCGHCKTFILQFEPQIISDYIETGLVYWEYISFIWTPDMQAAAEANYCAADQDKYWEYRDILFKNVDNQGINGLDEDNFGDFARVMGLDQEEFENCYESGKYKRKVQDDLLFAKNKGVTGTPSFLVEGELVYADTLFETIDRALGN